MAKARRTKMPARYTSGPKKGQFKPRARSVARRNPAKRYRSATGVTTVRTSRPRRRNPQPITSSPAFRFGLWFTAGAAVSTWAASQQWVIDYAPGGINPSLVVALGVGLIATFMLKGKNRQNMIALAFGLATPAVMQWGQDMIAKVTDGNGTESTSSAITSNRRQYRVTAAPNPMASVMSGSADYPNPQAA